MATAKTGDLFGHPKGLYVLFFAEMWERFSFYGMKALLLLYMVNFLFWKQADASYVLAWYAGLVYATPIIGGIIADKWLGARWSVVLGGVIIAIGHFLLAFEPMPFFYSGLGCLVVGTGFLKPNISTQVGAQYRSTDERRDSAFTMFYMGINLGAFIGPLICDWLRINYGYHYGFAAAGVGMILGLIVYVSGMQIVVKRERAIAAEEEAAEAQRQAEASKTDSSEGPGGIDGVPQAKVYRDRCIMLVIICVFAILFWVGFEQAANVMNLWADQHTNLQVFQSQAAMVALPGEVVDSSGGLADWRMGAAMTQSINPGFIISLAVVFAWLWQFLERRKRQPSTPLKMGIAMVFLAGAYGIMLMAASSEDKPVSAPLAALPASLHLEADGGLYSLDVQDDGTEERTHYGATRLRWEDGTLHMSGVLSDLDWMRTLGVSSPEAYHQAVGDLASKADERLKDVLAAQNRDELAADATWQVQVTVPAEVGELTALAGWPMESDDDDAAPKVVWDADVRTLTATGTLSGRDRAQVLANGAEPEFRDAVTSLYTQSSLSRISIAWLFGFYFVLTIGELCLSPVGLSLVTKAAPPKYVGLFMGLWFFTTGFIANFVAHTVGGHWGEMTPTTYFMIFGVIGLVAAVIMLVMLPRLKPLLHGIH